MNELLSVMVVWLSVNFGMPAAFDHPQVALVPDERLQTLRQERAFAEAAAGPAVHAFYDDAARTIYLPESWSPDSPAALSMLVHELVHHLQNVGDLPHACAAERERMAYRAQGRWLELFDSDLERAFGLDAMTLLVRTGCMH